MINLNYQESPEYSYSGYTCNHCGLYVPWGTLHWCPGPPPSGTDSACSGYNCIHCNQWVPSGTLHYCTPGSSTVGQGNKLDRIIELLEKILAKE